MKTQHRSKSRSTSIYTLECFECPVELITEAATVADGVVTVENLRPHRYTGWFETSIALPEPDSLAAGHRCRAMSLDVALSKEAFLSHMAFWSANGVYAVFAPVHLPFRASDLSGPARYRALQEVSWCLELAIPGPSGPHVGHIATSSEGIYSALKIAAERVNPESERT